MGHGVSTFVYGQHLVAAAKQFFEAEGLETPDFVVPGDGAKVVQALAAGQVQFAIGDASHPLKITEKGRPARILFATDTRCSYANIVVRSDLFEKGVRSVEALADRTLVGRKAVIAATGIGAGTYVYGVYVLSNTKAADGMPVNHHVEWMGGGSSTTILGGLKARKFDAIMALPEWQSAAVEGGFGRPIFDVADPAAWNRVFGGPVPVTVGYTLARTIEDSPDLVQSYVNACYRAQQWIRTAGDEEIVDLLWKRFMSTFERDVLLSSVRYYKTILDWDFMIHEDDYARGNDVWVPLAVARPIPFADAVDMSFVRKAQAG
jgi:NitT/TauT family transport system substrate-binding protein